MFRIVYDERYCVYDVLVDSKHFGCFSSKEAAEAFIQNHFA